MFKIKVISLPCVPRLGWSYLSFPNRLKTKLNSNLFCCASDRKVVMEQLFFSQLMKLERRSELRNWCVKMGVEFQ